MFKKYLYPILTIVLAIIIFEGFAHISIFLVEKDTPEVSITNDNKKRVICIGESTTEGGYPQLLQEKLNKKFPNQYTVYNLGESAVTSSYFKNNIDSILEKYRPNIVISMLGINDTFELSVSKTKPSRSLLENLYTYRLLTYLQDIFNHNSKRQRGLNLINIGKVNSGVDLLLSSFNRDPSSLTNKNLLFLAEYLNQESRDFKNSVKVYDYFLENRSNEDSIRIERLWPLFELNNEKRITEEVSYFESFDNKWYPTLGNIYFLAKNDTDKALHYFKNSDFLATQGDQFSSYLNLLTKLGKHKIAEHLILNSKTKGLRNNHSLMVLKQINHRNKQDKLARLIKESERESLKNYTITNTKYIIRKSLQSNAKVFIMQYPMRQISYISEIYGDSKSLKYIDNEQSFKKAVSSKGFEAIFSDSFAGDFGHMTKAGHDILTDNILRSF